MPANGSDLPPTRKTFPGFGRKKSPTLGMGPVTQRFFAAGEEQEASGYQHVAHATPLTAPRLEFESFDKIPRKRRPLFLVAGVVAVVTIGGLMWKNTRGLPKVSETARAMTQPVVVLPQPIVITSAHELTVDSHVPNVPNVPASRPVLPAAVAAAAAAQAVPSASASDTPPVKEEESPTGSARAPERAARHRADPESPKSAASEDEAPTAVRKSHGAALHGYVWSPEANALVPARGTTGSESAAESATPSAPLPERRVDPEEGRQVAPLPSPSPSPPPSRTKPAPFDSSSRPAREAAPIIE